VHPAPEDFLQWAQSRFEESRKRCNHLLKILRTRGTQGED